MPKQDERTDTYKDAVRNEWEAAAAGWTRWFDTLEAERAGRVASAEIIKRAELRPGNRVLDVACGYGEPGLTAAHVVGPAGRVVCCDISQPMVDAARARAASAALDNVDFVLGDVETLDVAAQSFDAVISRAGIMYFTDVVGALRRMRNWLRPGGRLAASVWSSPERVAFASPLPTMIEMLGIDPPPPDAPGPFALANRDLLVSALDEAGFEQISTGSINVCYELADPEAATTWLRDVAPPIAGLVDGHPRELQERVWRAVHGVWLGHVHESRVVLNNEALWVAARVAP